MPTSEDYQKYGRSGGKQLVTTYGRAHMSAIGRKGGEAFRVKMASLATCTVYVRFDCPYVLERGEVGARRAIKQFLYKLGVGGFVVFVLFPSEDITDPRPVVVEWDDGEARPIIEGQLIELVEGNQPPTAT
jgi:general stress protein YciG